MSRKESFTHLHLHTQASLLDGANLVPELVEYLNEQGMKSCAITDHGWMAGVVDFYEDCVKGGVKPLLGCEPYITEDEDFKEEDRIRDNMHMILIAKNNEGYKKLMKLTTEAALNNFYYKPRINKKKLESLSGDVIATTSCLGGIIAQKVNFNATEGKATSITDEFKNAIKDLEYYASIFNNDFYLELQDWDNGDHFQPIYNEWLLKIGKEMKLPFVLTADAHYLRKEDSELHDMLMAMQLGKTVQDYKSSPEMQYGPYFYVKTSDEMKKAALKWKEESAFYNTNEIANKCFVQIELGNYKEPVFDIKQEEDYGDFLVWKQSSVKNNPLECLFHGK